MNQNECKACRCFAFRLASRTEGRVHVHTSARSFHAAYLMTVTLKQDKACDTKPCVRCCRQLGLTLQKHYHFFQGVPNPEVKGFTSNEK